MHNRNMEPEVQTENGFDSFCQEVKHLIVKNKTSVAVLRIMWVLLATFVVLGFKGGSEITKIRDSLDSLDKDGGVAFKTHAGTQAKHDLAIARELGEFKSAIESQSKSTDRLASAVIELAKKVK